MAFLKTIISLFVPVILDWVRGLIAGWIKEKEQKEAEDKPVDDAVKKIEQGDLNDRLEGTDDLEKEFNKNS